MSHPDARPLKLPRYATGDSMSGRGRGWFYKEKYGRGGSGRRGGGGGGGGRGAHDGGTSSSSRWPPNQAPYTDAHNDGSPDARHGPAVGYYGEEREDDEQQEVHDGAGRAAAPAAAAAVRGSAADLRAELQRIDGRQYPAYKDIAGAWTFDSFTLVVDHVQGDAYAAPSRVRVQLPHSVAGTYLPHARAFYCILRVCRDAFAGDAGKEIGAVAPDSS